MIKGRGISLMNKTVRTSMIAEVDDKKAKGRTSVETEGQEEQDKRSMLKAHTGGAFHSAL